ncbi:MAG: 1-acyl-sn-glycerol-3-phosphate acyltransferase [Deltaproteobacteria bacterium]|nr:1-acyl-sn-glycerol-3-phosphate acyltransferase [Deltaproteobacteria bacterium]
MTTANHPPDRRESAPDLEAQRELEESLRALPPRYEPNALLRWVYRRFFDAIEVDPAWVQRAREAAREGTVVYTLRNLSLLDFLALDHLTKRFGLPEVRFANNLGLWVLEPFGKGVRHWLQTSSRAAPLGRQRTRDDDLADLRAAVGTGASVALFLKRPPQLFERSRTGRGLLEGDDFVRELLDLQRERLARGDAKPILLMPQVFLWTKRPDRRQRSLLDAIIGTREWPSVVRSAGQFLLNYKDVRLKAGEPLNLAEFVAHEEAGKEPVPARTRSMPPGFAAGDPRADALVRRAVYVLLRRLERERRVMIGPVVKPSDRIIDEVVRTPRVRKVIEELAGEGRAERLMFELKARAMLREIAGAPEPDVIRAMGAAMEQVFQRIYDGLEIDRAGIERLREASRKGTLILLPSHKSHIDYLFVSYVMFKNDMQVPLIAAGDNLSFFPLGSLFRRAGAFFIRRKIAGDRLYSAVLDAYVHKAVHEGWSMEFFLEGGRSRTGKLLPPKLGLLSMVVDAQYEHPGKPIYFVPISIGYERLVEAKSYVKELSGGEKEKESVAGLVKALRVLAERYGRINMQIGEIVTLDDIKRDMERQRVAPDGARDDSFVPRRAQVTRLGHQVIYEINRATLVTSGSLVALALLTQSGRGVSRGDLDQRCNLMLGTLDRLGARLQRGLRAPGFGVSARAIDDALALFSSAKWLQIEGGDGEEDAVYVVPDDGRVSIDLSKNVIVHFFVPYALIAASLLIPPGGAVPIRTLRDRVQHLSRLFKYEFMFRADASFEQIFDDTLRGLREEGSVEVLGDEASVSEAPDARARITLYATAIASFLESYRIVARTIAGLTKGAASQKEVGKKALSTGKRMFLSGEIARREAIQRPVFENAIASFLDQGILAKADGKLVLAESFGTIEAVKAVERRIASYLPALAPVRDVAPEEADG